MELDLEFVRAQFPAFQEPTLAGQAFFDNAGGSFACRQVIDRLTRFYTQRKVQPGAPYAAAQAGAAEMVEARTRLAAMLGVDGQEVVFGPSTSQNTYVMAQAFRMAARPGDAIIVTNQDHEANSGVWRRLADDGVELREWRMDPATGQLRIADLETLLDSKVRLVCFPHCSNVIGQINDVAAIVRVIHAAGAAACVDGVSYVPHGFPDVGALGADIYLFSAYKTYGPHQGIMVVRRTLGEALLNQAHYFNGDVVANRFAPCGPDHAQVAACAGMADFVDALHAHHFGGDAAVKSRAAAVHDLMRRQEGRLLQPLLDHLSAKNSVRLIGPDQAEKRAPTVAVELSVPCAPIAAELAGLGINCDGGDFYAGRALAGVGVDPGRGVLRMSFVHYTSESDISRLIDGLDRVLG
ncbi:MAG: aminotransferase class V-fold PLP-dependent enzyme [Rhodobacteraceae bacterium]|nr:aminotransferase class V-fold PLP-dependent enzyme [Paracoccaceae bacterium]